MGFVGNDKIPSVRVPYGSDVMHEFWRAKNCSVNCRKAPVIRSAYLASVVAIIPSMEWIGSEEDADETSQTFIVPSWPDEVYNVLDS